MPSEITTKFNDIIKYITLASLVIGLLMLIITAILVQDTGYILNNPSHFIIELLVMGVLTALPIILIGQLRGTSTKSSIIEFFILFIKIVIFHILLQLSGVFSVIFKKHRYAGTRNVCSDKIYSLITNAGIVGIVVTVLILVLGSILVHDTYYIEKNSTNFIIETAGMAIFGGIPVIAVEYLRNEDVLSISQHTGIFFVQVAIFHVLTQLSGTYSLIFPESADPALI